MQGVGNGVQSCEYDCTLPVAFKQKDKTLQMGKLLIPTVSQSDLPGLLGLAALRKNRGILDFNTMELHFCGPGEYDLIKALPPGTDSFQLELAPSGHMVLPCCEFPSSSDKATRAEDYTLTLMAKHNAPGSERKVNIPPAPAQPPTLFPSTTVSAVPPPPGFETH